MKPSGNLVWKNCTRKSFDNLVNLKRLSPEFIAVLELRFRILCRYNHPKPSFVADTIKFSVSRSVDCVKRYMFKFNHVTIYNNSQMMARKLSSDGE